MCETASDEGGVKRQERDLGVETSWKVPPVSSSLVLQVAGCGFNLVVMASVQPYFMFKGTVQSGQGTQLGLKQP